MSHISPSHAFSSEPCFWVVFSSDLIHLLDFWKSKTIKMIFSFRNCWFKSLLKTIVDLKKITFKVHGPRTGISESCYSFVGGLFINPIRMSRGPKFLGFLKQQVLDLLRSYMWFKNWCGLTDMEIHVTCPGPWSKEPMSPEEQDRCWKFLVLWGNHRYPGGHHR